MWDDQFEYLIITDDVLSMDTFETPWRALGRRVRGPERGRVNLR